MDCLVHAGHHGSSRSPYLDDFRTMRRHRLLRIVDPVRVCSRRLPTRVIFSNICSACLRPDRPFVRVWPRLVGWALPTRIELADDGQCPPYVSGGWVRLEWLLIAGRGGPMGAASPPDQRSGLVQLRLVQCALYQSGCWCHTTRKRSLCRDRSGSFREGWIWSDATCEQASVAKPWRQVSQRT